eukprot:1671539-Amphidinium_carterae.1
MALVAAHRTLRAESEEMQEVKEKSGRLQVNLHTSCRGSVRMFHSEASTTTNCFETRSQSFCFLTLSPTPKLLVQQKIRALFFASLLMFAKAGYTLANGSCYSNYWIIWILLFSVVGYLLQQGRVRNHCRQPVSCEILDWRGFGCLRIAIFSELVTIPSKCQRVSEMSCFCACDWIRLQCCRVLALVVVRTSMEHP